MTAQSAINASTQTRQSESNWFGRGRFSIVGGSRLRAGPEFIAEGIIIRECGDGVPPLPGGVEPRHHTNFSRRRLRGKHGRPLLRDKSRGFLPPSSSRKIAAPARSRAVSCARAAPDPAARAAKLGESQTRFPDSPATPASPATSGKLDVFEVTTGVP